MLFPMVLQMLEVILFVIQALLKHRRPAARRDLMLSFQDRNDDHRVLSLDWNLDGDDSSLTSVLLERF